VVLLFLIFDSIKYTDASSAGSAAVELSICFGNRTVAMILIRLLLHCVVMQNFISAKKSHEMKPHIAVEQKDMTGVVTSLGNMLVNYEHKFLFCPIQKAGSSLWTQLFLRMGGDKYWCADVK
jgi:hypothetical protein